MLKNNSALCGNSPNLVTLHRATLYKTLLANNWLGQRVLSLAFRVDKRLQYSPEKENKKKITIFCEVGFSQVFLSDLKFHYNIPMYIIFYQGMKFNVIFTSYLHNCMRSCFMFHPNSLRSKFSNRKIGSICVEVEVEVECS
jgi:hypothetical protein